jgi:hypothetical protein
MLPYISMLTIFQGFPSSGIPESEIHLFQYAAIHINANNIKRFSARKVCFVFCVVPTLSLCMSAACSGPADWLNCTVLCTGTAAQAQLHRHNHNASTLVHGSLYKTYSHFGPSLRPQPPTALTPNPIGEQNAWRPKNRASCPPYPPSLSTSAQNQPT